ncbi:MAG: CapA family protein [Paraclostridium sp.]|uniref:CapA family protein n=1 Tax=Paraclostridium sp. TaxID=2023273 RepID=UPI003F2A39E9
MKRTLKKKRLKYRRSKVILLCTIVLTIVLALIFTSVFIFNTIFKSSYDNSNKNENPVTNSKNNINITLSAVGDIMVHDDQLKAQFNSKNKTYNFDNNFKYIKPYISSSNLAIANLETTLAGSDAGYSSFPRFNSPDELADSIKNSGFDIVSTINNHAYDRGSDSVYRTLDVLKSKNLKTVGTKKNSDSDNFLIQDVDGIKLGITSYSYGQVASNNKALNGLPIKSSDLNNMNIFSYHDVDSAFNEITNTLDNMNKNKTDLQVVVLHWGNEYERNPNEFQIELANKLCDYGVDIIIGSHPHVVQPIEMIKSTKNNNETLVIYSMGNFLSNQRNEILNKNYTEDGVMVNIDINKNLKTDKTTISGVEYIPTWVNKYTNKDGKLTYEIIPIINKDQLSNIKDLPLDKVENSYNNTTSIIKSSDIIKVKNN